MRKPVIGITTTAGKDPREAGFVRFYANRQYADAIAAAGGVPILLTEATPVEDAIRIIDGLLVPGGEDIDARHFGQEKHPESKYGDDGRFIFEQSLYRAMPATMPYLGICYGCQALNVFRGGDLVQHIPDSPDTLTHTGGESQEYVIEAGSQLADIVKTQRAVGLSYHHQANGRLGGGLRVCARAADGTIEAIEDVTGKWQVAVQWHPERTPDDSSSVRLFRSFVEQCSATLERQ